MNPMNVTRYKAIVSAIGATATGITAAATAVSFALADDAIDITEIGGLATAIATLAATVWGVWRVPYTITEQE